MKKEGEEKKVEAETVEKEGIKEGVKKEDEGAKKEEEGEEEGKADKEAPGPSLVQLLQPVLSSLRSGRGCGRRLVALVGGGRGLVSKKLKDLGDFSQVLTWVESLAATAGGQEGRGGGQEGQGAAGGLGLPEGVDLQSISSTLRQLALHARDLDASLFEDVLQSLEENPALADALASSLAPPTTSLLLLLATPAAQQSLQEQLGLRLSSFAASFGMAGLTLENFPERLAPWVGLFASDWGFRPMVVLGPLRDFLKGVLAWAGAALAEGRGLGETELRHVVHRALRDDVINTLLDVRQAMTSPKCFSRRLCEVSRGQDVTSLKRAVVRVAGVTMATAMDGVSQDKFCDFLDEVFRALEGDCQATSPNDCKEAEARAATGQMDLKYEHSEL